MHCPQLENQKGTENEEAAMRTQRQHNENETEYTIRHD
jgi:hypothetical protein